MNRRTVLQSSVVFFVGLSGCLGDYPRHRELDFDAIQQKEKSEGEYKYEINLEKSGVGESEEWETFHNVRVLGYTRSGEQVCVTSVGTVSKNGEGDPFVVQCSAKPAIFAIDAAESACDKDTKIGIAVHPNGNDYWKLDGKRECDEPLPPDI